MRDAAELVDVADEAIKEDGHAQGSCGNRIYQAVAFIRFISFPRC